MRDFDNHNDDEREFNNYSVNNHIFDDYELKEEKKYEETIIAKDDSKMKNENGKKVNYKLSKDFLRILGLTVSGILLVLSLLTGFKSFVPKKQIEEQILSYTAANTASYVVNLSENNFYETKSVGMGELLPVTFIDNIEIDFASNFTISKQTDINYSYRVTGEIVASTTDGADGEKGGKIWTKSYTFVEPKSLIEPNGAGFNVMEHVVIDYKTYNDLVNQYKLKAAIPMNAVLKVTLTVDASSMVDGTPLNDSSTSSVEIPLSVPTVMISATDSDATPKMLTNTIEIPANNNYVLLGISAVIFLGSLGMTVYLLSGLRKMTEEHSLLLKFNKIMRDYNQVIIEIEELPEVKDAAIIEVKSFKDMLDIEKELHLPIMCAKAKDDVLTNNIFYIINQNQIFKYRLNNEQERF